MGIAIKTLGIDELNRVAPLWDKLRLRHLAMSAHFKVHFERQTFAERCEKFRALPEDSVHIGAAEDEKGTLTGYCICSVQDDAGELDSIFVEAEYRGQDIGYRLARDGVDWLKTKGCRHIDVMVAEGNEDVFPFYEKLGFRVRATVLQIPG